MNRIRMSLAALLALVLACVPAFAQETVPNPVTGDNSMVALALIVMGVAAAVIVVLLLMGRKKKK